MDLLLLLPQEELQALTPVSILLTSISIPRSSPRTFSLITLTLVFPLSFAALAHAFFPFHLLFLPQLSHTADGRASSWVLLWMYQFIYLVFLFTFSLLSTAAVVFSVASLHASRPVSFSVALSAIPPVFSRLFSTFLWFFALMIAYYSAATGLVFLVLHFPALALAPLVLVGFLAIHVCIAAVWHLACVVTALEPVRGLAAMRKSMDLLKGKRRAAALLVLAFLVVSGVVSLMFRLFVVRGDAGTWAKVVVGGLLVAVMVLLNMVGLLVQSVFYYVCKSYHHQTIDKTAMSEHLGGYLGEYVPLKSDIQMENI